MSTALGYTVVELSGRGHFLHRHYFFVPSDDVPCSQDWVPKQATYESLCDLIAPAGDLYPLIDGQPRLDLMCPWCMDEMRKR